MLEIGVSTMNAALQNAIQYWPHIASVATKPRSATEFDKLVVCLDELLEIVGSDENHPLIGLVDLLSNTVAAYEAEHFAEPLGKGIDALRYLMVEHELRQSDLPEIGSQGVVSEILSGQRSLNLRQMKALARRFGIDPATFLD
jgi:HTH-type transcriptional regulator/antitoxin HigA